MRRPAFAAWACLAWLFLAVAAPCAQGAGRPADPLLGEAERLLEAGRVRQSEAAFARAYEQARDPATRAVALVRRADVAALFRDNRQAALGFYDKAIKEFPDQADMENAWFNSAMILFEMGRWDDAEARFESCLRRYPDSPRASTVKTMLGRAVRERAGEAQRERWEKRGAKPGRLRLGSLFEPRIRVRLAWDERVRVGFPKGMASLDCVDSPGPFGAGECEARADKGRLVVCGRPVGGPAVIVPRGGAFELGGRTYLGELLLSVVDGKVAAVNRLPMETYLEGVVPLEMYRNFEIQALQAQAVASRSLAMHMARQARSRAWDVTSDTMSQVYGGAGRGNVLTRQAVASTRGEILTWRGELVPAYFHAHSGGVLEDDAKVWTEDMELYRVRQDPLSQSFKPLFWEWSCSDTELGKALARLGKGGGRAHRLEPVETSPSGRVSVFRAVTDKGSFRLGANGLRLALGPNLMKSTLCRVAKQGNRFVFTGRGHGHGVGLSQWGAEAMALRGSGYRDILSFYFPGARLSRRY